MGGGQKYEAGVSRAVAGVTDDDIYAATVRIFADDGFSFIDKDKDAGIVTTSYREAGMEGGLSTTRVAHAWRARIEEGTLRLEIGCQALGSNGPYPCSFSERNADWVAAEPRYRQRIMDEAERRSRKRSNATEGELK